MNKIINIIVAMTALLFCFSCNDEWEDEQFAHYVSFKAPITTEGCTPIYVKYNDAEESVIYQLPLIVSGSTVHNNTINAVVELDPDSLYTLNMANIGERRLDIWFKDLSDVDETEGERRVLNDFPTTVTIPAGQTTAMLNLELNLKDLDQSHRWILPLKIAENQPGYQANTRKHYNNAMLNIIPFNDFSGTYVASSMLGSVQKTDAGGNLIPGEYDEDIPYAVSDKIFYATGENTAFFYAGAIDYTHKDREDYRVNVEFGDDGESLRFWPSEKAQKAGLNFSVSNNNVTYFVAEEMDPLKSYLLRKTTVVNIEYYMTDRTQGAPLNYKFKGAYSMLRIINTQIPDQDQAIQW